MRVLLFVFAMLLAGCAAVPGAKAPAVSAAAEQCGPEVERLSALLAAEVAERQRAARAAVRREEALRKQLDAMKSIERGILERGERVRSETR